MKSVAVVIAAFWLCIDCNASAADILAKCRPIEAPIRAASTEHRVPYLLMVSLAFAESSCNTNATHAKTGAVGVFQVMTTGAGIGYSTEALKDPWLNSQLAASHLAKWKRRCGTWRGAVEVFGGRQTCKARSEQGAKIIRVWRQLQKESERVS